MGDYVSLLITLFLPAIAAWAVIVILTKKLSRTASMPIRVISALLIISPSWGPATITFLPVPLGLLLLMTIYSGDYRGMYDLFMLFPIWHLISLPFTALVFYCTLRIVASNKKIKRTR